MTDNVAPHCDAETLTALAADDLPAPRREEVETHLRECDRCRADYAQLTSVWTVAKDGGQGVGDVNAVRAALYQRLPAQRERRHTMLGLLTPGRLALGGVGALAVGAALWLVPGTPVRPLPAFADVERAMEEIETATWAEYTYYGDGKTDRNHNASVHNYTMQLRPEPLMISRTRFAAGANGKGTREMAVVVNRYGSFTPPDTKSGVTDFTIWDRNRSIEKRIREKLFFGGAEQAQSQTQAAAERDGYGYVWTRGSWKRDGATLNGRAVLRFTRHEERRTPNTLSGRKPQIGTVDSTIYADSQTFRIIRAEARYGGSFAHMTTVRASFRYNVPVAENVALVMPPTAKTVEVIDFDLVGPDARRVPAGEATQVRDFIAQAAAGWGSGKFAEIVDSSLGTASPPTPRLPRLQNRRLGFLRQTRERNQRLREIAGDWSKARLWRSFRVARVLETGYSTHYPYTSPGEKAAFPPPTSGGMYNTVAVVQGVTKQGKTVTCPAQFETRRVGEGLRLTVTAFFPDLPASEAENWTRAAVQKRLQADLSRILKQVKSGAKSKRKPLRRQSDGLVG